ncbi:hypothetical protein ACS0TY_030126 [Phlomoides rotata]
MDASESPLSTSPSPTSYFSPQRHFYLAVDRLDFKMETLLDLLSTAGRRPCLPMVVCCSTRDELDAICSNVSNLSSHVSISSLYSDLSEVDRAVVLDNFREATVRWNRLGREEEANGEGGTEDERKSHVVVVSDACVPFLGSVESPLCGRMLINYELPTKKVYFLIPCFSQVFSALFSYSSWFCLYQQPPSEFVILKCGLVLPLNKCIQ